MVVAITAGCYIQGTQQYQHLLVLTVGRTFDTSAVGARSKCHQQPLGCCATMYIILVSRVKSDLILRDQ